MHTIIGFEKQNKLLSPIRKAINDYGMIEKGDHVVVGVSGKDSMSLLIILRLLQHITDHTFDLTAVTLTLGLDGSDLTYTKALCERIGVPYHIEETLIGKIVFEERQESNPCSLCAKLRRGALNATAKKLGATKIALGHHKDDVLETFLLCTLYEGRLHAFSPITHMDKEGIPLIRPMIYLEEKEIKAFVKANQIEPIYNPCPANGKTTRQEMKDLVKTLSKLHPDAKTNLFGSIKRSKIDGWHTL